MQSCFKVDLGLIKLSTVLIHMCESKSFLVTIMKWRISGQGYKHLTRFSTFLLFKPAANTMQKINPVNTPFITFVF